ncbi:MAG: phage holin family protein [Cyclobacteriaceae bacterium]
MININKLKEALAGYVKVKVEMLKLDITEHLSKILSQLIAFLIIFIIATYVLAFASFALANFLNDLWGNSYGGFLVLSGIYLVLLLTIVYLLKSGKMKKYLESILVNIGEEEDE